MVALCVCWNLLFPSNLFQTSRAYNMCWKKLCAWPNILNRKIKREISRFLFLFHIFSFSIFNLKVYLGKFGKQQIYWKRRLSIADWICAKTNRQIAFFQSRSELERKGRKCEWNAAGCWGGATHKPLLSYYLCWFLALRADFFLWFWPYGHYSDFFCCRISTWLWPLCSHCRVALWPGQ